jgi:hypothetical protein
VRFGVPRVAYLTKAAQEGRWVYNEAVAGGEACGESHRLELPHRAPDVPYGVTTAMGQWV